jgi:hypothetical protein
MKRLMDNIAKLVRKFISEYKSSMTIYGEALLRGGSYGC